MPLFGRYGGYVTIGDGLTTFTGMPETEEECSKYPPATRTDPNDFGSIRPQSDLETLRAASQFFDLWDWKSSRTNPLGLAEDASIGAAREGYEGVAHYFTNFDEGTGQPPFPLTQTAPSRTAIPCPAGFCAKARDRAPISPCRPPRAGATGSGA